MTIAVDFDGTIVEHEYPAIGKEKPFAIEVLKRLVAEGNKVILYSVREGELLDEAVEFCRERGLRFYAVNSEYPPDSPFAGKMTTRKVRADMYIDDRNVGGLPEWGEIYEIVAQKRFEKAQKYNRRHRLRKLFGK